MGSSVVNKNFLLFQDSLTERELEIAKMICSGVSSQDISIKLNISSNTVRAHIKNILKKLNLQKIHELSKYRKNLVSDR